ncbi:MAG: hypothetical protein J7501_03140 [Bdellovibrio sp.]|nr:hypothetical protein [Bdellovibrio sp.]
MKKHLSILFVLVSLIPAISLAWTSRGNGGNVVVCGDKISGFYDRIELELRYSGLVDKTDIREFPHFKYSVYPQQVAFDYLQRLKSINESLYQELVGYVATFYVQAVFVNGYFPKSIDDSGVAVVPEANCTLEQVIVQKRVFMPTNTLYTISVKYWDSLSLTDQAAAILHEVIYRAVLTRYPEAGSSEGVRVLNSLILSNHLKNIDPTRVNSFIEALLQGQDTPSIDY